MDIKGRGYISLRVYMKEMGRGGRIRDFIKRGTVDSLH